MADDKARDDAKYLAKQKAAKQRDANRAAVKAKSTVLGKFGAKKK